MRSCTCSSSAWIFCCLVSGLLIAGLVCPAAFAQTSLHRVWRDDTGGTAYGVAVSDGWTFVSNNAGVSIYDVHQPDRPRFVSLLDTAGAFGLSVAGNTLYVAAIDEGLLIFDIADPANPRQIGSYGRDVSDVLVHDDVAYLRPMYGGDGEIVDVSDPVHPLWLTRIDPINSAVAVGEHLWVGMPGRGVVHMDISDPTSPSEVGVISGTAAVVSLELRDDYLYVAMYGSGTSVYDVSNPSAPRPVHTSEETGESWHVSGEFPIACVADLQEGVEVLDLSLPFGERLVVREDTLAPHELYCLDRYVHVADQDEGYVLLWLEYRSPPRRPAGRRQALE